MEKATYTLRIPPEEHRRRGDLLCEHVRRLGCTGAVLFDRDYLLYYAGFAFIVTERPMALLFRESGERILFVPRLEAEHAAGYAAVDRVEAYPEYPDDPHPMRRLVALAEGWGLRGSVAADEDGYPWVFGYRGPRLSELAGWSIAPLREFIEGQLAVKSQNEIRLIGESVRWGHLAHTLLQRYTRPGATETEVSRRASSEATRAMLDTIGPIYRAQSMFEDGASANYRGQIGRGAAIPHALAGDVAFRAGDVLVTGASAPVWGYTSELERTMILGAPTDEQRRMFAHMLALQDAALAQLRPGGTCAQVDRTARAYFEEHQLTAAWRHHTGHAIGLRYHEGPFLDRGDGTVLRPGMVFTVEPGLYVPDLGGFRHSDTVVITPDGMERLTYYPRDLESLTLPA
jgi:Xaa-Pro aminopeptidase